MTDDLNKLRRLAEAAGGGEWHEKANTTCCVVKDSAGVTVALCSYTHNGTREVSARQKAAFIAAANPAAILSLLDRVKRAEAANASWVGMVRRGYQRGLEEAAKHLVKSADAHAMKFAGMDAREAVKWSAQAIRDLAKEG